MRNYYLNNHFLRVISIQSSGLKKIPLQPIYLHSDYLFYNQHFAFCILARATFTRVVIVLQLTQKSHKTLTQFL